MAKEEKYPRWMRQKGSIYIMDYNKNAYEHSRDRLEILPNDFNVREYDEYIRGLPVKMIKNPEFCDKYFAKFTKGIDENGFPIEESSAKKTEVKAGKSPDTRRKKEKVKDESVEKAKKSLVGV